MVTNTYWSVCFKVVRPYLLQFGCVVICGITSDDVETFRDRVHVGHHAHPPSGSCGHSQKTDVVVESFHSAYSHFIGGGGGGSSSALSFHETPNEWVR